MKPVVLAITGASGAIYAVRLLDVLLSAGYEVHTVVSFAAGRVFQEELNLNLDLNALQLKDLAPVLSDKSQDSGKFVFHQLQDWSAGIASGSFQTAGMVVCPCSMGTLASLANGLSSNLIHRAADVHLKERRKLIVVPRETPLGSIPLQNMKTLSDAGAVILPAMPGFYHQPQTIQELVDFIVARICDQLGVTVDLVPRWGTA